MSGPHSEKTTYQDLADLVERLVETELLAHGRLRQRVSVLHDFAEELVPITGTQCGKALRKFVFCIPVTVDHDPNTLRDIPNVFQGICFN